MAARPSINGTSFSNLGALVNSLDPNDLMAQAAATKMAANNPKTRGLLFKRALGKQGVTKESLRMSLRDVGLDGINVDNDEEVGQALSVIDGIAAGGQADRWTGSTSRGSSQAPEDWGFYKVTTASGSTGAEVAFSMTLEVGVKNLVLHLWDPESLLVEGYLTDIKVDRAELILSPVENQEFIPAQCLDITESLGHERGFGGIYIGDVDKNQVITGSVFIPTATQDVTWGWVGRCVLQERVKQSIRLGRGRG